MWVPSCVWVLFTQAWCVRDTCVQADVYGPGLYKPGLYGLRVYRLRVYLIYIRQGIILNNLANSVTKMFSILIDHMPGEDHF